MTTMPQCIKANEGWDLLLKVEGEDGKVDFVAEPIIAFLLMDDGTMSLLTIKGRYINGAVMRPDGSVFDGENDHPDFATFLLHVRGDPWSKSANDESPVTPAKLVAGAEACIEQGPNSSAPKLDS